MFGSRLVACTIGTVLGAVVLAGCGQDGGAGGPSTAGPTLAVVAESVAPSPTPTPPPTNGQRFGKTFIYAAGLRIKVGRPERFRPSPWIERLPGTPMKFRVVIHNRTEDLFNPSQLHVRLTSGFQPAVQIYDADKGVVARPERRVPPGETVAFSVGYWVEDEDQLSIEVLPGFGYASTVVTG